jgi:glycosyltransferase involved in cell wall biosynthesis
MLKLTDIDVFISTTYSRSLSSIVRFKPAIDLFFLENSKLNFVVQYEDEAFVNVLVNELKRLSVFHKIKLHFQNDTGLSNSRNLGLKLSSSRYLYLTDDDVTLNKKSLLSAITLMNENSYDFLINRVGTPCGSNFKDYSRKPSMQNVNFLNSFNVSSVEILLCVEFVKRSSVSFDTRFGLGAPLPSSEEYIFITDLLRNGALGAFSDFLICLHPIETSGRNMENPLSWISRGAMFRRVFGFSGLFLLFAFFFKRLFKRAATLASFRYLIFGFFTKF